jgi:nucleotide-binding universal stress UspA family protein
MKSSSTTIVVGVDGSPDSLRAVEWAAELAALGDARVVAVHAMGLLEYERADPSGEHLRPELEAWTAALRGLGVDRVERRLVPGEPVGALLKAVDESDADLIVVGTRGAGARIRDVLGSTSLQLAERCKRPLVIVPYEPGG